MTKANKLRNSLRANNNRITMADALKIVGTRGNISNMIKTGEIEIQTLNDVQWVALNPNHQTNRKLPVRRTKKKRAHKKHRGAARNAKSFKEIADKHTQRSNADSVFDRMKVDALIIDNALIAGETLAKIVRDQVSGLEKNPELLDAIRQQERAAELARAAHVDTPF